MRVLLVEDEHRNSAYVKRGLEEQGYAVDVAYTGREAMDWAAVVDFDLIVLDVLLPEVNGLNVCRELRFKNIRAPILILTARDSVDDRVAGLDAAADDYLVKPFAIKELLERSRALARRAGDTPKASALQVADLTLDTRTHRVTRGDKQIELSNKEFAVLECLMREPNRVLSRTGIAEHVWNYETYNDSNVVDLYIRNLRRKLDDTYELKLIRTVRGACYSISAGEDETI